MLNKTFCNDGHCQVEDCDRHQKQLKNIEIGNHPISAADFPYCDMHSPEFIERLMERRNSKNDIDKDIENVKNLLEWSGCETSIDEKTEQSIKNVLSELEIYKKIVYYLGKEYNCTGKIEKFKDVLEWSEEYKRKEVK